MQPRFSDFKLGMKLSVIGVHSHFWRIDNSLICWTFLVYLMEDDPVSKGQCVPSTSCAMHVEKKIPHHLDTISIVGADICAAHRAQLATSAMMEQTGPSWWPHYGRPCRRPCCRNWSSPAPVEAAWYYDETNSNLCSLCVLESQTRRGSFAWLRVWPKNSPYWTYKTYYI